MSQAELIGDPTTKYAERDMLNLLHDRYGRDTGNGMRYICAEHVRSACGWAGISFEGGIYAGKARTLRTADFMVQELWEAQGMELSGFEVKVSRSDWLHELADPTKAEAIKRYCDRWWLVVPDKSIVRDDLPHDWGLLAIGGNGRLRIVKRAPKLSPEPIPATFRASLLRAVAKTATRRQA